MLLRCIRAENRKLHASPIWFMFFILPIISAGYGTFNYLQNLEILRDGWYSLWTQHTLFYSLFFFPCMVAVYAAYLWRLEHIGHNWNLIMAEPVPPFYLFLAKLLVVTKLVLLTQAFVFVLYWFCGRVFAGFTAPPAGHYHLLPGAQCTGRAGRGGGAAAIFHGDPQLCLAGVFGAGRGCFRHAAGQPGLLVRLALLPDAARHER